MTDNPERVESLDHLYAAIANLIADVGDSTKQLGIETDGYGKCVEAMWRAGYLATEYVAHELGVTGFQHSMAMLMLYGQAMGIEGPYMMLKLEDARYPQYDLRRRVEEFLTRDDSRQWLADEARRLLAEHETDRKSLVAPRVVEHWRGLVAGVSA